MSYQIAGHTFQSRLLTGTCKFQSASVMNKFTCQLVPSGNHGA
ncbi:hypothetical protein ALON55S_04886 [Alishewanella longhuensis]